MSAGPVGVTHHRSIVMPVEMGQPANSSPDRRRWVVGVDTHTDTHAAALVDALGEVHAQIEVSADPDGYTGLLAWAGEHLPAGQRMFWAVEGCGCRKLHPPWLRPIRSVTRCA